MEIGIMAESSNKQVIAQWALKEFSSRNKLMDQAVAIKLALCKAREQQWRKIQVGIPQQHLLQMLRTNRSKDMSLKFPPRRHQ